MSPRWTIVHDFAYDYGGAERVTEELARSVLPHAQVLFLGASDEVIERMGLQGRSRRLLCKGLVRSSTYRQLAPVISSYLWSRRPIAGHVLASSYALSHLLRATGVRVVYCHSPIRQAWTGFDTYSDELTGLNRVAFQLAARSLRRRDLAAATSATSYVATSTAVRDRIADIYRIEPPVIIPPPVDLHAFSLTPGVPVRESYLWVGRIVEPYKRLGLAIEAFKQMPERQLKVAGYGRDESALKRIAPSNVEFLGPLNSGELADLYRSSRGLIFPSVDDFGIVPVESMACGCPVIAFKEGGAVDTIIEGSTGVFFDDASVPGLIEAIDRFESRSWDRGSIARHAAKYSPASFTRSMRDVIQKAEES